MSTPNLSELHGPVHIMIGGQWWVDPSMNFSATNGGDLLLASKWLWRQGYIRCPETCSEDTPDTKCVCSCPSELTTAFETSKDFINGTGLFALSDGLFADWRNFVTTGCRTEDDCYDIVKDSLCHVGHAGVSAAVAEAGDICSAITGWENRWATRYLDSSH